LLKKKKEAASISVDTYEDTDCFPPVIFVTKKALSQVIASLNTYLDEEI
jgi:hypothetical protein